VSTCTLPGASTLFDSVDEGGTLDELIAAVWRGLGAHRTVDCPVCEAPMRPEYGVHARPIGGRCSNCGSTVR
jgi:hypothetical protein